MTDPTSQCPPQPTPCPVLDDDGVTPARLLARAADDYASTHGTAPSREDRVHGNEIGRAG